VDNEIQAIECCIEALNGSARDGDDRFVLKTLREMYEAPYKGRGLGIGSHRTGRVLWEDSNNWPFFKEGLTCSLSWLHALLLLFDGANLSEKAMFDHAQQITQDDIIFNHILEHILENLAVQGAVDAIKEYIPYFKTGNVYADNGNDVIGHKSMEYYGWRILLRYYARNADADNFFKTLKLCEPSKDKYDMECIKGDLVQTVALTHGIEAALKIIGHKNIGERYAYNALSAFAEAGEYEKLKEIFSLYQELRQPEKETEMNILAVACEAAAKQGFVLDDTEFDALFARAVNINPKLKWGDSRLRDWVVFNLGLASKHNKERYTRCRKAIKNNWIKKELSDLHLLT
jgi:hypothetical protein